MKILKKNKYLSIISYLIIIFYFLFGIQLALSKSFLSSENVICKNSNDFSKQHGLKYSSHCLLDLLSDYNFHDYLYIEKKIQTDKSFDLNKLCLNFLEIDPKINSPPVLFY